MEEPKPSEEEIKEVSAKLLAAQKVLDREAEEEADTTTDADDRHEAPIEDEMALLDPQTGSKYDKKRAKKDAKKKKLAKAAKTARSKQLKVDAPRFAARLLMVKEAVRAAVDLVGHPHATWHDPCGGDALTDGMDHEDELGHSHHDPREIEHLQEYTEETGGYLYNIVVPEGSLGLPKEREIEKVRGCCTGIDIFNFFSLFSTEQKGE